MSAPSICVAPRASRIVVCLREARVLHIHRLAQRWGLTNGKNVIQTEKDLKKLFPKKYWNKLHLQIIYYGREFCKARDCYGISCKICTTCYPNRKKPIKT